MTRDLDGRRAVVTGASRGLGRVTAIELAHRGAGVVATSRSRARARTVADASDGLVQPVELHLDSLDSVESAAGEILSGGPVDVLVNNAGIAVGRGATTDGFERIIGVNYIGPYLLTRLLLPHFGTAGRPRIVNLSSDAHRQARGLPLDRMVGTTRSIIGLAEYALSKLAIVLWGRELSVRHPEIDVYTVHPGMVATGMWPQPLRWLMSRRLVSPEEGARTQIKCATDPSVAGMTGRYWIGEHPTLPSNTAQDDGLARELWEWTEAQLASRGRSRQ